MSKERQVLEQWVKQNPSLFGGLKQAISGAEGTILGGKPGYNVMFGGGRFKDLSRHPDKVISSPGGYSSDAAGAYQFKYGTWSEVQKSLGLQDFGPRSQDIGMLKKVRDRLMPLGGLAAITKAGSLTPEIQAALAPEWASFPTASGKSYYGQPVKKAEQIQKFFQQGAQSASATPAQMPSAQPAKPTPAQQGNFLGNSLLQRVKRVMGLLPLIKPQSSLMPASTPELTGQSFLDTYRMFFDDEVV